MTKDEMEDVVGYGPGEPRYTDPSKLDGLDLEQLIKDMNEQYEEVDSKEQKKEVEMTVEEIMRANKVTQGWINEEKEYRENLKDEKYSEKGFSNSQKSVKYNNKDDDRDKAQSEKQKAFYNTYNNPNNQKEKSSEGLGYGYGSRTSSDRKTSKTSDEVFYEETERVFSNKIVKMISKAIDQQLNLLKSGEGQWDILDLQYELNRKRSSERKYEERPTDKIAIATIEKHKSSLARKIDMAELLLLLKVNPRG